MKRIIWLLPIILLIIACNPAKRLAKICKDCPTKETIVTETKTIIDTFTIKLPPDTIRITDSVPCDDFELTVENNKQKILISVLKGKLEAIAICKEDSLKQIITSLEKKLSEQQVITVKEPYPVEKKVLGPFAKFCIWGFWILFAIVVIRIYIWARTKWFKK